MSSKIKYIFKIDGYTPQTMPFGRLVEYYDELKKMFGSQLAENMHLVGLEEGSHATVWEVDKGQCTEFEKKLESVGTSEADKKAQNAFDTINNMLHEDETEGAFTNAQGNNIIHFPGKKIDEEFKGSQEIPHKELGSVEGNITTVGHDGHGRAIVRLKSRLNNQTIKCISDNGGLDRIGHYEVDKIFEGLHVLVSGLIEYKNLKVISEIKVHRVDVYKEDAELPGFDEIVDPNFTDGIEANAYLQALRKNG